jgi:TetR/AcrR family transcriptional regulator, cholesterol catabolism regulator
MATETTDGRRRSARSKHDAILDAAIEAFGRDGYEDSKWADVAKAVGIGSTALYHYFESMLHCLYVIMADTLEARLREFEADTQGVSDYPAALEKVLRAGFDLTDHEVLCHRVLIAEQALLAVHRTSPREEEARQRARARTRDLEFAWATFLSRAMEQGAIPEADPRLLTRAVLGLHNSVWHWYRTGGDLTLPQVADFFVARCLDILGLPAAAQEPAKPAGRKRAAARRRGG